MRLLLIRHGETGGNANMRRAIAELEAEHGSGNYTQKVRLQAGPTIK
jgi:broad specificity phosphatase PhoE